MNRFAVIGDPIAHSLSPVLFENLFRLAGIESSYERRAVKDGDLAEVIADLRAGIYNGINVTLPHKQAVIPYLDRLSPAAEKCGAVNCISVQNRQLVGDNTDIPGIRAAFERAQISVSQKTVLLLGAGGAARAAFEFLTAGNVAQICIAARRRQAAEDLLASQPGEHRTAQLLGGDLESGRFDIVINATPVGMWPNIEETPISGTKLRPHQIIFDIVYNPHLTRFLRAAKSRGCKTVSGLDMFLGQGLAAFHIWHPSITIAPLAAAHYDELRTALQTEIENRYLNPQGSKTAMEA